MTSASDSQKFDIPGLKGAAQLSRQLQELGLLEDGKALQRAANKIGRLLVNRAKAMIPVGRRGHKTYKGRFVAPGFAQRNIQAAAYVWPGKTKMSVVLGVRNEAFYAVQFVDRGTVKQKAQPWLEPAFDSTRDAQIEELVKSLQESIEKAVAKR